MIISLSRHFKDNITKIHASFPGCDIDFPVVHKSGIVFKPASFTEIAKLILSSPNKSYELDPMPTFLLKSCLHTLIVPITKIINLSRAKKYIGK